MSRSETVEINARAWEGGDYVADYANRKLLPVEIAVLIRRRSELAGRTLEIGCGAGRILGYLLEFGGEAHGIDVSPAMVEYCKRRYPQAEVRVGDLREIGVASEGPYDAVIAGDNVLDVLDDAGRRAALSEIKGILAPGGVLIFSSHNLAYVEAGGGGRGARRSGLLAKAMERPPAEVLRKVARLPRSVRNRHRLAPLQVRRQDHAILNDEAHEFGLLHYYIRRDDQERQLEELGYELLECLDADGRDVPRGEPGVAPWLHYVARPTIEQ
jgi:SAM-dependent methyltransferase